MTCQRPVTQLYIRKEGKSGLALREMSRALSKLSSKLQKANQHLFQDQNCAWSLQDPSQPTSHSKSSMLSGYQVSPELDWSFQSGQDPRTK